MSFEKPRMRIICNEADIICLTETHLDQNITNDGIFIEGYCKDPFRKDRNNSGGGVIVYFSNHLIVQPRTDLNFDSEAMLCSLDTKTCYMFW
jgi:hypothetical protein